MVSLPSLLLFFFVLHFLQTLQEVNNGKQQFLEVIGNKRDSNTARIADCYGTARVRGQQRGRERGSRAEQGRLAQLAAIVL